MNPNQLDIPIQPVEQPILCSPYEEPDAHWVYDTETGEASQHPGRREAGYWYKTQRTGTEQLQMRFVQEEERDDLPLVNALRADVKRWRESNYRNATNVTRELLNHWTREEVRSGASSSASAKPLKRLSGSPKSAAPVNAPASIHNSLMTTSKNWLTHQTIQTSPISSVTAARWRPAAAKPS